MTITPYELSYSTFPNNPAKFLGAIASISSIFKVSKFEHPLRIEEPIVNMFSLNVIDLIVLLFSKAKSDTPTTGKPLIASGITTSEFSPS